MKKYELMKSLCFNEEYCIQNNATGEIALLKLKSMKAIRRKFKIYISDNTHFCFTHMSPQVAAQVEAMLPKHYLPRN